MLTALRKADNVRVKKAARKITIKCRLHRRKMRAKTKSKTKDKVTYMAGAYGLGAKPEDVTGIAKGKRKCVSKEKSAHKKRTGEL